MEKQVFDKLVEHYKIPHEDSKKIWSMIEKIYSHEEFIKRLNSEEFPHHDTVSLGEHIVSDAIVTYLIAKKKDWDIESTRRATTIAMFHDLYELPWQNSGIKKSRLTNKHGFTHPLEGAINAATWYPSYFEDQYEEERIIDGIVHHMFPFPVRAIDGSDLELNNEKKYETLPSHIKGQIITSSTRFKIGPVSICRSRYPEGRIMSKADKIVSFGKDLTNINGITACITGHNKNLIKK